MSRFVFDLTKISIQCHEHFTSGCSKWGWGDGGGGGGSEDNGKGVTKGVRGRGREAWLGEKDEGDRVQEKRVI